MINEQIGLMSDLLIGSLGKDSGAVFYSKDDWKNGYEGRSFRAVFLESFKDIENATSGESAIGFTGTRPVAWYKVGDIEKPRREDVLVIDGRAFRIFEVKDLNVGMVRLDLQELT